MKDGVFEDVPVDAVRVMKPISGPDLARMALSAGAFAPGRALPAGGRAARKGLYQLAGKRVADILFVLLSLPVFVPVTMICALALWIEGGQPFYRQQRLGRGGRSFSIVKLRTMCREADDVLESCLAADPALRAEWDRTQKLKNDPRITRVGGILRKTSLDELPQLWNVLLGQMSVVGPRPMMPAQLPMYDNPAPYFALRPGITGLWQVSDRNENSFAHRSTVDAAYHADLSFPADLRILLRTVGVVLRRTGY